MHTATCPSRITEFLPVQILNYVAGGRDVSANISFMCQTIIRGPAAPLVKKLAYDVVQAAPLSDSDWSLVIEGLRSDIVGTFSLEVTRFPRQHSLSVHKFLLLQTSKLLRMLPERASTESSKRTHLMLSRGLLMRSYFEQSHTCEPMCLSG